ncbi:MAG: glycoside hydrolase family 99-like domain-containing protein [Myxococcales bacterium]|nr:glycoside hydrolase family 99-like domain-containing protein [Myxococcales bacterium]
MSRLEKDPAFHALSRRPDLRAKRSGGVRRDDSKLIAFYLPQYHRIPENSEWWGPGFTEWTNVVRGRPNFDGHYQPHLPRELGFYDLSHVEVMEEQAELAKLYGVYGFCFYHYWFSGRRVLERPLENFLRSEIDLPFCLCWANENWTRTWDGDARSVLLEQKYAPGDDEAFVDSLLPFLTDPRYIHVDGKPLLVVYRAKELPRPKTSFATWRKLARDHGFDGLHIAVVDFYDISHPDEVDADALIEFPPHKFNGPQNIPSPVPAFTNPHFGGGVLDYSKMIAQSALRPVPSFRLYRGIVPGWDNTARRQNTPTIIVNSHPELYGKWLEYLRAYTRTHATGIDDNFIFVNAWNEWAEGCHLEPDQKWGLEFLEQTLATSFHSTAFVPLDRARDALLRDVAQIMVNQRSGDAPPGVSVDVLTHLLMHHQAPSEFVRRVAATLKRWPALHGLGKKVYSALKGM